MEAYFRKILHCLCAFRRRLPTCLIDSTYTLRNAKVFFWMNNETGNIEYQDSKVWCSFYNWLSKEKIVPRIFFHRQLFNLIVIYMPSTSHLLLPLLCLSLISSSSSFASQTCASRLNRRHSNRSGRSFKFQMQSRYEVTVDVNYFLSVTCFESR